MFSEGGKWPLILFGINTLHFIWGRGVEWPWGQYLDCVPISRIWTLKAGELLSPACSVHLELQKGRRFKVSCWPLIPRIIFPFVFSQPGNPSSNPSKSLFLSSKPSSCSVSHKEGEQLAASEEQPLSKPAHPSVLQDCNISVSDTCVLITFASLPHWHWRMQSPAGPAKHCR